MELGGPVPSYRSLVTLARRIEAVGFDSLWLADELNPTLEDGSTLGYWECWTILSAIATETKRIALGPLVSSIGFRNPGLLAKMAITLDEVSGGRLAIGLGAGYDESEHQMFGFRWDRRVSRLDEYARVLRALLRDGHLDFSGQFFQARDARVVPRPGRPGEIPIVIGTIAIGPRLFDCVARHADIWNVWLALTDNRPAALAKYFEAFEAACERVGRDPGSVARSVGVSVRASDAPFRLGPDDYSAVALAGSVTGLADAVAAFAEWGVSEVVIYAFPIGEREVDRFGQVLEALDRPTA
jgi:alkanesulfonate monooxygenase SsuD/methylene tetrahydromethanopterin reductase-like flavin-dependent oxidoreductase (luciferase family)